MYTFINIDNIDIYIYLINEYSYILIIHSTVIIINIFFSGVTIRGKHANSCKLEKPDLITPHFIHTFTRPNLTTLPSIHTKNG